MNELTGGGPFPGGVCPTQRARGESVGEGYRLSVRGNCQSEFATADLAVPAQGVYVWDGDVAIELKIEAGFDRGGIALFGRYADRKAIVAQLDFHSGEISLLKRESGNNTTLSVRSDLSTLMDATTWQRLALRFLGGEVWVLLNDRAVLYASDVMDQDGAVALQVARSGALEDDDEVAVVFRHLELSAVDGTAPERQPAHVE